MAKGIAHRDWSINRSEYDSDQDFRAAVEQEMALCVQIMERLGVAIIAAPARNPLAKWRTEAVFFRTDTVPSMRAPEPEAVDDDVWPVLDEPEAALVEDVE